MNDNDPTGPLSPSEFAHALLGDIQNTVAELPAAERAEVIRRLRRLLEDKRCG